MGVALLRNVVLSATLALGFSSGGLASTSPLGGVERFETLRRSSLRTLEKVARGQGFEPARAGCLFNEILATREGLAGFKRGFDNRLRNIRREDRIEGFLWTVGAIGIGVFAHELRVGDEASSVLRNGAFAFGLTRGVSQMFEADPRWLAALVSLSIVSANNMGADDVLGAIGRGLADVAQRVGLRSFFTSDREDDLLSNPQDFRDAAYGTLGAIAAAIVTSRSNQEARAFLRFYSSTLADLSGRASVKGDDSYRAVIRESLARCDQYPILARP